jgi:hypothetical protein
MEEIEFGLLESKMLPTPNAMEGYKGSKTYNPKSQMGSGLTAMAANGMLPTPTAMDSNSATANMKSTQVKEGSMHSMTLSRIILNTPRASDKNMHWKTENWKGDDLGSQINEMFGTRSHLNPQFVAEMMGFPPNWTELPFLNGDQKV